MARKGSSRVRRAVVSSLVLLCVAMTLAISNIYMQGRDRSLALGPKGEAQASFFENAPDRPDIAAFYKTLSPRDKLIAAKSLSRGDSFL